ncbi:hypothetical protein B484DRAFT_428587, partial [Ochromonadaceae sp. CCMP2298]
VREHCDSPEYAILFQEIPFPSFISPKAADLISKLLDVSDKTRLGSGPHGSKDIKAHPFFADVDWDLMEQKHVEPPYKPAQPKLLEELVPYPTFEGLMVQQLMGTDVKPTSSHSVSSRTSSTGATVASGISMSLKNHQRK